MPPVNISGLIRLRDANIPQARRIISGAQVKGAKENRKLIDGEHWDQGRGWIGPLLNPQEEGAAEINEEIRRAFTSRNASKEVCSRHRDGVVGKEPSWKYTVRRPVESDKEINDEEKAAISEAEAAVTSWWDTRQIHSLLQEVALTLLHQGRAEIRILIPKGLAEEVEEGAVVRAETLDGALRQIFVDSPNPWEAAVVQDPTTMEEVSFYVYQDPSTRRAVAELTFVRMDDVDRPEQARTVHRLVTDRGASDLDYPLGGHLLQYELRREPLMTQQVREQQKALNLAVSMVPRTVITAGFLEMVITGGQMPGYFVNDESAPNGRRFVRLPFYRGPGTVNFISGEVTEGMDGKMAVANPGVHWREPVSAKSAIEAKNSHYEDILQEADQAHHLIAGNAFASAISRVEARLDFLNSLRRTQVALEQAGRWLLETVLALAEAIVTGGAQLGPRSTQLRAVFKCRVQTGQLSADEQRIVMERVEKGLISYEDAMALLDVDDVDAMIAKVNSQPGAQLDLSKRQAEVFAAWLEAGAPAEYAAQRAGLSDEEVAKLRDVPTPAEREQAQLEAQAEAQAEAARQKGAPADDPPPQGA